jgi:DNA-binding response OmpR family regulator
VIRVLLVDDDRDILEALEMALSPTYEVITAVDGEEALDLLRASPFDVAIVDLMMPVLDGASMVRRMREEGIETPVVIASATPELRSHSPQIDAVAMLQKPFGISDLERCIELAVGARGPRGGGSLKPPRGSEPPPDAGGEGALGRARRARHTASLKPEALMIAPVAAILDDCCAVRRARPGHVQAFAAVLRNDEVVAPADEGEMKALIVAEMAGILDDLGAVSGAVAAHVQTFSAVPRHDRVVAIACVQ